MPKYKVREGEHIQHDGKEFHPGDVLSCTEEQAALLRVDMVSGDEELSAKELIEKIKTMATVEEVAALFTDEKRATVKDALKARIKELKAAEKK